MVEPEFWPCSYSKAHILTVLTSYLLPYCEKGSVKIPGKNVVGKGESSFGPWIVNVISLILSRYFLWIQFFYIHLDSITFKQIIK